MLQSLDWARAHLQAALERRGWRDELPIPTIRFDHARLQTLHRERRAPPELASESFLFEAQPDLTIVAGGTRGATYALCELADRVTHASSVSSACRVELDKPILAHNRVRSIARSFQSSVEDLPWFRNPEHWDRYLDRLVCERFNRFSLILGLQYNYAYHPDVSENYLYFPFPFLVDVPDSGVQVSNLAPSERQANREALMHIARECQRRGLDFQLGLWTFGYNFATPKAVWRVDGITEANHARYCRDALAQILNDCQGITGITFRIHVEGGIAEGRLDFWQTVFEAVTQAGRPIEIDLHAKGIDLKTIDAALATGNKVIISPKYLGEHMGLPYHQASIRDEERPPPEAVASAFAFSEGERRFLRYSYGDLLPSDRNFGVIYRIWPGTQRILLWGDPALAAGYGTESGFCGSEGVEWCEPLSFKGRMGSGVSIGRSGYDDPTMAPHHDFDKYEATYRIWGRCIHDPHTPASGWERYFDRIAGPVAPQAQAALATASRILPLITLVHTPSVSNNTYWPELYTNMSLVVDAPLRPYAYDMQRRPRFGAVGACDPQLFSGIDETVAGWIEGLADRRYSPLDAAQWLEQLAMTTRAALAAVQAVTTPSIDLQRLSVDCRILAGIGHFFAEKFRCGIYWSIFERTASQEAAKRAIDYYQKAHRHWQDAAIAADGVYWHDQTYGMESWLRGHWRDRTHAIECDIRALEREALAQVAQEDLPIAAQLLQRAAMSPSRPRFEGSIELPSEFTPGQPVDLTMRASPDESATLHFRRVNQSEFWQELPFAGTAAVKRARIPGAYTETQYPLQAYVTINGPQGTSIWPGLASDLANRPYRVILPAGTGVTSQIQAKASS